MRKGTFPRLWTRFATRTSGGESVTKPTRRRRSSAGTRRFDPSRRCSRRNPIPVLECAFYSFCNSEHFVGVVALVNSLRLVGHEEPLFLVDSGLTSDERSRLAGHVTLIPAPQG